MNSLTATITILGNCELCSRTESNGIVLILLHRHECKAHLQRILCSKKKHTHIPPRCYRCYRYSSNECFTYNVKYEHGCWVEVYTSYIPIDVLIHYWEWISYVCHSQNFIMNKVQYFWMNKNFHSFNIIHKIFRFIRFGILLKYVELLQFWQLTELIDKYNVHWSLFRILKINHIT